MIVIIKVADEYFIAATEKSKSEILNDVIEHCPFPAHFVSSYNVEQEETTLKVALAAYRREHKHGHWYTLSRSDLAKLQTTLSMFDTPQNRTIPIRGRHFG